MTVYIINSKPEELRDGDRFVINRQDNVEEWPEWASYMDVLDGKECRVVEMKSGMCVVDAEFPEGSYGYRRGYCNLIKKWLSKIDDQELNEIEFDIKELF